MWKQLRFLSMKLWTLLFLTLIGMLFSNCDRRTKIYKGSPSPEYMTSADSRLYFRNVRSLFYIKSVHPGAEIDLYTFKTETIHRPIFRFFIADNWMYDEAYFMLDQDSGIAEFSSYIISYTDTATNFYHTLQPTAFNKPNFLALGYHLREAIQTNSKIYLRQSDQDSSEIYNHKEHREALRITLTDYEKLVNK